MTAMLADVTDAIDASGPETTRALHSSWSLAECGTTTGWARAWYVGGVTCPDCLYALPAWAANEAAAVQS